MLTSYTPMAPTQVREPFHREGWVYQEKVDAGLIAKDEASLYEAGATRRWLKVKQNGWTVEEDRWQRRISAGA